MSINILPWQNEVWQRLTGMGARLPHALLLHGRPGIGKLRLAEALAQSLLCENRQANGLACASCPACGWFAAGNHPDFRYVQPEILMAGETELGAEEGAEEGKKKASKQIKIQQIIELSSFLNAGSHRGGHRVILIHPAEAMNPSAANALLKSLEEPSGGVVFVLVSHQPSRLLATVRSRCHALALPMPPRKDSLAWLREQGNAAPEAALAFAGDAPLAAAGVEEGEEGVRRQLLKLLAEPRVSALALSELCQGQAPRSVVEWMLKWTYDLVATGSGAGPRYYVDRQDDLGRLAGTISRSGLFKFERTLLSLQAIAEHPLNPRLFFDDLFIAYKEIA